MPKTIATVEFEIPGHSDKYLSIDSDQSLLDYDIIVFTPEIRSLYGYSSESYKGKPCLNEQDSFSLAEKANRWRQELRSAFEHGKTVFIFMPEVQEVFVDSGNRNYSGTGRSRVTTKLVDAFNNYSLLPMSFTELVSARGREIKPAQDLKFLGPYWKEFGAASDYEVYFTSKSVSPLLVTKTGSKTVGGIVRDKAESARGAFILLPPVRYEAKEFTERKGSKAFWNKKGVAFGN
ncbi:MAG TPA: hypothetical protein VLZ12_13900, partial [Verrucomicrobiae bacterium]|nr:hypothetical protein [Verrucomicrobiae bacterium]